jgi:DNA-binding transcriptional LysR family regulator
MAEFRPTDIHLKPLRAFDAVARHRSFSRAAVELGRSQTTVSLQVRELERQIGLRLLERTTRRVTLTEAGAKLADAIESGFRVIDAGLLAAHRHADGRRGRIILACVPSLSASRLPSILSTFGNQAGSTRIDVEELTSAEIVIALLDDRVDLGIGPCADLLPPEIAFTPVVEEPLCAVLAPGAEPTGRGGMRLETLAKQPLVTLSGSVLLLRTLEQVARTRGLRLTSAAEVRHVGTAIAMARAGLGTAIVPRLSLPDEVGNDLLLLPIVDPPVYRRVGIITRRDKPFNAITQRLARHIRSALSRSLRRAKFSTAHSVE